MNEIIINAAEAMEMLRKHYFRGLKEMIAEAPEVVRCKDCKWMSRDKKSNRTYCHGRIGVTFETAANGYCYLGERKDDGQKD